MPNHEFRTRFFFVGSASNSRAFSLRKRVPVEASGSTGGLYGPLVRRPIEEVIGRVRDGSNLPDHRAVGSGRPAAGCVHALDKGRVGKDAWSFRDHGFEPHPRYRVGIHSRGRLYDGPDDSAATVAYPRRAHEMAGNNVAVVVKQRGVGYWGSPTRAVPGVDLYADSKPVKVDFVGAGIDCDLRRNLGRAVVVARGHSREAGAQEQAADSGFDSPNGSECRKAVNDVSFVHDMLFWFLFS